MKKIIPNGTEVLIFKYIREWGPNQDEENYNIGIIESSEESDDLSYHGSPWYEQIYTVIDKDGKKYIGCYGSGLLGNSYFRTKEDHIRLLEAKIKWNDEKIGEIQNQNQNYQAQINVLLDNKTKQLKKIHN